MDPGLSSIFLPSRVVGEIWRTEGWTLDFILNPSRIMCEEWGEVWRAEGWTLDFPLYLSFLGLWVKHGVKYGERKVGPWIFLYSFSLC